MKFFCIFFLFFYTTSEFFNIRILTMNRSKSLERLLDSFKYFDDTDVKIDLEIFIDALPITNNIDFQTLNIVQNINWSYGKKEIVINPKNYGLKKQWLRPYFKNEPLLIIEDDIVLCKSFFKIAEKSLNFLKTKNNTNVFGVSFQKLRLILKKNNCNHFEPEKCLKNKVKENNIFYLQQMATWAPLVFRDKWNELIEFYESSKYVKPPLNHSIPGSIANLWYNTSGTFIQYFFFKKKYFLLYFNTKNHIALNFLEKGVHFKKKKTEQMGICADSNETDKIDFSSEQYFDQGFTEIFSLS